MTSILEGATVHEIEGRHTLAKGILVLDLAGRLSVAHEIAVKSVAVQEEEEEGFIPPGARHL